MSTDRVPRENSLQPLNSPNPHTRIRMPCVDVLGILSRSTIRSHHCCSESQCNHNWSSNLENIGSQAGQNDATASTKANHRTFVGRKSPINVQFDLNLPRRDNNADPTRNKPYIAWVTNTHVYPWTKCARGPVIPQSQTGDADNSFSTTRNTTDRQSVAKTQAGFHRIILMIPELRVT